MQHADCCAQAALDSVAVGELLSLDSVGELLSLLRWILHSDEMKGHTSTGNVRHCCRHRLHCVHTCKHSQTRLGIPSVQ
jgi:hypothetical protein